MRHGVLATLLSVLAAGQLSCGGEEPAEGSPIRFQQHALMCNLPGCDQLPEGVTCIQAELAASGVGGTCQLVVSQDRTVSGVCRTPAKEVRDFRLVYYTYIGADKIQLAVVLARLDLREETRSQIELVFPQNRVMAGVDEGFDDDGDGRSNIQEVCEGTNPRLFD